METNALASDDFDSVATAVYQAIDNSPSQRMDFQSNPDLEHEEENDEAYDDEDEIQREIEHSAVARVTPEYHVHSTEHCTNADEDEVAVGAETKANIEKGNTMATDGQQPIVREEEDEAGIDTDSLDHSFVLHYDDEEDTEKAVDVHKLKILKSDNLILHNESGLIKKIKLSATKSLPHNITDKQEENFNIKTLKIKSSIAQEEKPRSSTPFSREYIALQKSVNASKILTEFVTDAFVDKTRKLRTKDQSTPGNTIKTSTPMDHSYSSSQRRSNANSQVGTSTADNADKESDSPHSTKRQQSRRFIPLKDERSNGTSFGRRSRSRSIHNYDSDHSNSSYQSMTKKWPSDERIAGGGGGVRRANMRSENSEFVQKQKDFLQHVINSTQDTPRRRSRSRSAGVDSTSGQLSQQQLRPHKSKERLSKRFKADAIEMDDDDKPLMECIASNSNIHENLDDTSVNDSNNSVSGANTSGDTIADNNSDNLEVYLKEIWHPPPKSGSDSFCWKCHESKVNLACSKCIRSYHASCAKVKVDNMWVCPECTSLDNILNSTKRSRRNELPLDLLSQLLAFALKRMRYAKGHYSFLMPYEEVNAYKSIIINPVTFDTIQAKVTAKEYRCTEEFVNDTKWMLHNANILAFGNSTKTASATKAILKICRQEANEIETCAECYLNANTRTDWFVDVCSQPHLLLWAKLKGFPYWPAKAMGFGQHSGVNVKFFGEHDRAFVPIKECYLYSVQDPNPQTGKRAARELADCIKEVEEHIEKIKLKVGAFNYAPYKTPYDPTDEMKQLEDMMPGVQEFIKRQQGAISKPSLQFKIYKTADNNLSIVQKDVSTPELLVAQPQQSQQDVEDLNLCGVGKKKKMSSPHPEAEEKNIVSVSPAPAKYEVISKVSSDDSHSSKLSPVILKRKSTSGGDIKKVHEDEANNELLLPKLSRIEDYSAPPTHSSGGNHIITKRNMEIVSTEKAKSKHAKHEPKIPVLAIKTALTNIVSNTLAENIADVVSTTYNPTPQPVDAVVSVSQNMVENLVKNKQGVTIKKIAKGTAEGVATTSASPPVTSNTQKSGPDINKVNNNTNNTTEPSPKTTEKPMVDAPTKEKTVEQKQRYDQKVNNVLKGLVPFVEVKKEVFSDNEEEQLTATKVHTAEKQSDKVSAEAQSSNTPNTLQSNAQGSSNLKDNTNLVIEKPLDSILLQVKEEVFTDEDEAINDHEPLIPELCKTNAGGQLDKSVANTNNNTSDVRVVGETIIQKLSNKNANYHHNSASANATTSSSSTMKRNSLKGIPYGPLPASALTKTSMPSAQSDTLGLMAKAKKSFPQPSQPLDNTRQMTTLNNNESRITACNYGPSVSLANQPMDGNKRSMSRTTMVAIPVDVAATSRSPNSLGTMISSIPVPPLTAVSKIPSAANACNSVARNIPATVTVSGTSGSLTTPAVISLNTTAAIALLTSSVTISSTTMSVATRSSPVTVVTSSAKSAASLTSAAIVAQNPINPLTMSTPPPLAGLSGVTLTNNPLANGTIPQEIHAAPTSTITTTATGSQTESSLDTQLLSGLVTPTLATAITDIISRGPPKLASRPRGPLQSEGYPMHALQAGPVSKRLVDNAHKITDYFISVMEDTMGEIAQGGDGNLQAKIVLLEKELERTKQFYEQQILELKRTSEVIRISMDNEKTRVVNEVRKQCEAERLRSVEETKRKQWCAHCSREANFYCCWNTSYCDYPCQQLHWSRHAANCAQTRPNAVENSKSPMQSMHNSSNAPQERHQNAKSNSSSSTPNHPSNNYITKSSTSSMSHSKKDKILAKSCSPGNHLMNASAMSATSATTSSISAAAATVRTNNTPSAEVLKLPTNTYLRPVTSTALNNQIRCNTTYSIPVQRFNVPLPLTTHANSNGPHTFTIVRQGSGWSGPVQLSNTVTSSTIAAPIVSVPQVGTQRSSATLMSANKNTKAQIRYH